MFGTLINSTPFTSEQSDIYFSHFKTELYKEKALLDKSFIASLRALLGLRISPEEEFFIYATRESAIPCGDSSDLKILDYLKGGISDWNDNCLGVILLSGSEEDRERVIKLVETSLLAEMPGYQKVNRITEFFKQYFPIHCFVSPDLKKSVIIADDHDSVRLFHYLQSAIPPALPWFFENSPLTDNELKLIRSLRESKSDDYLEALNILVNGFDFRTGYVKEKLKETINNYDKVLMDAVKEKSKSKVDSIRDLNIKISILLSEKAELDNKLLGLQTKAAESNLSSELTEYFLCNKNLHITEAYEGNIEFAVTGNMVYFDEELAERIISNERSSISNSVPPSIRALLTSIFVKGDLKLRVCAGYKLNLTNGVVGMQRFSFPKELRDFFPNPHINGYGCLGNYSVLMNQLTLNGDFINVVEQCVASCQSVDWGDHTVMTHCMSELTEVGRGSRKIIELPDKKAVSVNEAIEWLESQGDYVPPEPLF